jgi:hypothetical protein
MIMKPRFRWRGVFVRVSNIKQKVARGTTTQMVFRNIYGKSDSAMAILSGLPTSTNLSPE